MSGSSITLTIDEHTVAFTHLDAEDHISKRILQRRNFYERDLLDDMRRRIAPGQLAIDVGAHIGNHSLWMAAICGLEVIAFEPNPASYHQLENNIRLNGLEQQIIAVPGAAGATHARARLELGPTTNTGMTRITIDERGPIRITTIDTLEAAPALIKIDVEGHELDVLEGARATIATHKPLLYIEAATENSYQAVAAWLAPYGYKTLGRYAATPTYCFSATGPAVRLSAAIMAHPQRRRFVDELQERLEADVEVIWDRHNDRWDTGRRALAAYPADATHHLVIQDDAIPSPGLLDAATQISERNPHCPTSYYLGKQRPYGPYFTRLVAEAARTGANYIIGHQLLWGVALSFPVNLIPPMLAAGDTMHRIGNYDTRLSQHLGRVRGPSGRLPIPCWFTIPSLADHREQRDSPSLIPGRDGQGRVAHRFLNGDACSIPWMTATALIERRHGQRPIRGCPICGNARFECSPTPLKAIEARNR